MHVSVVHIQSKLSTCTARGRKLDTKQ